VRYLVERIAGLWGEGAAWRAKPDRDAAHEAHYLTLDASKARNRLGWQPKLDLDTALALTVAWYKAFSRGQDMHAFSLAQIAAYAAMAEPAALPA
jgi:CDP-glucose 4,6-dehydratase